MNKSGDDFIRKVIDDYSDVIFRASYQYVRNRQDSEDVLQETLLELMQHLRHSDFQSDEHMKAWLIRVAVNKSINVAKYHAKHRTKQITDLHGATKQQFSELESVLNRLSATDREVIYLHYFEGYSAKEIAEIIQKTEKSVFKRLSRSRKKLKDYISEGEV